MSDEQDNIDPETGPFRLSFDFPNRASLNAFAFWLCDGGGEDKFRRAWGDNMPAFDFFPEGDDRDFLAPRGRHHYVRAVLEVDE